ncbi:MAG TPA: HAMP domain-containing sensor histidine kinase [Anaerolineales bacterium]|nr:HAMP domain-containing sensor histidine kinase [Anaerolineales bacterium]HNN12228.1 HAMP domain-containing sensor histidine kinase [Anaerolineales bacterium]
MFTSLRSRLWLSYAFLIVTALSVVTIVMFVSLFRSPLMYRQTLDRMQAVQSVLIQRMGEPQSPSLPALAERASQTFDLRVLIFSADRTLTFDSSSASSASLSFPARRNNPRATPIVRDDKGAAWLYSMQRLSDGTFLVVAAPRPKFSIVNIFSDEFLPVILLGGGIALLLSLIVAFLFSGWIADPLQAVVGAVRGMPSAESVPVRVSGPHEVQELTRAFNSMTERMRASQKSQREFVANVSHEMKTPLTSIQGFAQAMLDGAADTAESRQQAAQIIYNESGRMHRMVLDLLDLAKLDAGTADLKMSPVNMRALLNAVAEKFTPQSQRAGVRIEVVAPENLPLVIADGDRMAQVFTNLVDNALKFTPRDGDITLSAEVIEAKQMHIRVKDSGVGIPEDEQAHIFQRFYQADPARGGGERHGAGLGLAIAHEIVFAHGGRISVQSRIGQGTTMEVVLPLIPADATKKVRKK